MSNHEFTLWTALPNGIAGGTARLSVFVTPKLLGDPAKTATLNDYKAILNWPETVKNLRFKVSAAITGRTPTEVTVQPSGGEEFSPDSDLWKAVFSDSTLVEPVALDAHPADAAARRGAVTVYYRSAPLQALIEETYAVQSRLALQDLEGEPRRPVLTDSPSTFDSPDALLRLASGPNPPLAASQFATPEGDQYRFRPATVVSSFFAISRAQANAFSKPLTQPFTPAEIRDVYTAFSLYHKRGIRNQDQQIRQVRNWKSADPHFNFRGGVRFQIETSHHRKEFEFAESTILIDLPALGEANKGFEVIIRYAPNEALPAPSNENDTVEKNRRAADERVTRYADTLEIFAADGNPFADGTRSAKVTSGRTNRISWDGARWIMRDRNELDFHAMLSAFAAYPGFLRRLGWVFDIEVPQAALFPGISDTLPYSGKIKITPVWGSGVNDPPTASVPWTVFKIGDLGGTYHAGLKPISLRSFAAATNPAQPDGGNIGGFRNLSKSLSFQYDLDATLIKRVHQVVQQADQRQIFGSDHKTEVRGSPRAATLDPSSHGPGLKPEDAVNIDPSQRAAAVRSTGISLYSDRDFARFSASLQADAARHQQFKAHATAAISAAAVVPGSTGVFAEGDDVYLNNIISGYAIDVLDESTGRWRSLCERQLTFSFRRGNRLRYLAPMDEGWVASEAMAEVDEQGTRQLRKNENLFRWDGWSLAAPDPSKPIKETRPEPGDPGRAVPDVTVAVHAKPQSLPRLRFGHTYRFRARIVDLAGNAWLLEYANAFDTSRLESPAIVYRRFDPLNPPFFVGLQPPGPGRPVGNAQKDRDVTKLDDATGPDQGETLVIRSGMGTVSSTAEWLVLPAEVKVQEAKWMGAFDEVKDPDDGFRMLERYCGALPESYDPAFIRRIRFPNGRLGTPYLPDIHAAGAAFTYLPGGTERKRGASAAAAGQRADAVVAATTKIDFSVDLSMPLKRPLSQPFRLRLAAGDVRKAKYSPSERRLSIVLPPGEQQLVRVSAYPIEQLETFAQVHNALNADQRKFVVQPRESAALGRADWESHRAHEPKYRAAILAGQFWPLTPQKNVYLIHAVPKPIVPPAADPDDEAEFRFSEVLKVPTRASGSKTATLTDEKLRVHRASTGRLEVYANWKDYSDVPGSRQFPTTLDGSVSCFNVDVPLPDITTAPDESHLLFKLRGDHDFPTTKHYAVHYSLVATTRYLEYFDPKTVADPKNTTIRSCPSDVIHITNTVPPQPPDVVYVLPILIRDTPEKSGTTYQRTTRRGLRVYMRRTWFSSGEGERLAVVLAPPTAAAAVVSAAIETIPTTQWGTNPIWATDPIRAQPKLADALTDETMDFPPAGRAAGVAVSQAGIYRARAKQFEALRAADPNAQLTPPRTTQITLAEGEVQKVDVAAFAVHLDIEKNLLFADIEFQDPASYSPQVKLALARYQHHSSPYTHLSTVVPWVFHTISPKRVVTYGVVKDINEDPRTATPQVKVTVGGRIGGSEKAGYRENNLEAVLLSAGERVSLSLPLRTADGVRSFMIPVKVLRELVRPTIQIVEYEHVGTSGSRIVFADEVPIDRSIWK
jgi:hypothetical protein